MGHIQHDAILWTGRRERAPKVEEFLQSIALPFVAQDAPVNGYRTIVVTPDGSKEGWEESDRYDQLRAKFVQFLKNPGLDIFGQWVEVSYGESGEFVQDGTVWGEQ